MRETNSPTKVLAQIPGWQGASWSALAGGQNNASYRVTKGDLHGVLKINDGDREPPFNTRAAEAKVQSSAAAAGLAGRVLFVSDRAYLSEYLDGVVWTPEHFDQAGSLEQVAMASMRVHALPLTGRTFDAQRAAESYCKKIAVGDDAIVAVCMDVIRNSRMPKNLCCCHNDLVAENLVSTPKLMFLDWEFACDNDPLFDLATVVEHHRLSDDQACQLQNYYCAGHESGWQERFAKQRLLYLALLWLWMAATQDADPVEMKRIARRVITSCS